MTRVDTSHPAYIGVQQVMDARKSARKRVEDRYKAELQQIMDDYRVALLVEVANMKDAGMSNYAVSKALNNTNWNQVTALVDDAMQRRATRKD